VLLPFAIAWLLAYFIHPLVCFVQKRMRLKYRALSIFVALAFIIAVIVSVGMLILPSMYAELNSLRAIITSFLGDNVAYESVPAPLVDFVRDFSSRHGLTELLQRVASGDFMSICMERIQVLFLGTLNVVKQVFAGCVILLYLFFILLDFDRLSRGWKPYVPKKWRGVVSKLWNDLVMGMNQYFRGQALVALCVGILFSVGFTIIDFPIAIAFGLFVGMLNLVPYLQIASLFPMVLLALMKAANTGENFWLILFAALVVLCIVQVIQDLILVPRIMGKRMNLHPAVILLSLSVWGSLLGMLGMIIALPFTTLLIGYVKRYHELHGDLEGSLKEENESCKAMDGSENS
jgi:predicted PurR-regulated permease PerM